MMKTIRVIFAFTVLLVINTCDNRSSVNPRIRELPSFTVEMTLIKNLATGANLVEAYLERDGYPFSDAVITVGDSVVPVQGGGLYYIESNEFPLPTGTNIIKFDSSDDGYVKSVTIEMPDDFGITEVSPRYNPNADVVFVEWSASAGASNYILAVATLDHGTDGTQALRTVLPSTTTGYFIPDTTFEDYAGDPVPGTYYIYLISFNEGFGPYSGIRFSVPEGLPEKVIIDPVGVLRFGTVAALDSITVPF